MPLMVGGSWTVTVNVRVARSEPLLSVKVIRLVAPKFPAAGKDI